MHHGMSEFEMREITRIRAIMDTFNRTHDRVFLAKAKHEGAKFVRANKQRRVIREAAMHSIKHMYAHV